MGCHLRRASDLPRIVLALAVLLVSALGFAGCDKEKEAAEGPSKPEQACEAMAPFAGPMGASDEQTAACVENMELWEESCPEALDCFVAVKTADDVRACNEELAKCE